MLDEQSLSPEQMRVVVASILGGRPNDYPHPSVDFPAFLEAVNKAQRSVSLTYSPYKKEARPWILTNHLSKTYSPTNGGACIMS